MKNKLFFILGLLGLSLLLVGCQEEKVAPMVNLGIEDSYMVARMQALPLHSAFKGKSYSWTLRTPAGKDSVIGNKPDQVLLFADTGIYQVTFEIKDPDTPVRHQIEIAVLPETVPYSPYITRVLEYCPAPGQFINKLPKYVEGDTHETMCQKVLECIGGTNKVLVSLGAYGGYVTFGFDHTVVNKPGVRDFEVRGNAFITLQDKKLAAKGGGSAEPGIVLVALDVNGNGKPDPEEWYQLAGSEYHKPETDNNYSITYYKPDPNKPRAPSTVNPYLNDTTYVAWTDNKGGKGYVYRNTFHEQSYWPEWVKEDKIIFSGSKLASNYVYENGIYTQISCGFGYVDNEPNNKNCAFDIDWAVDANGDPVKLPGIDFVRVYTGRNEYLGWIGETSTEVESARDLHVVEP